MGLLGLAGVSRQRDRAPHRLGAALTYARRYALFTLVGLPVRMISMRLTGFHRTTLGPTAPANGNRPRRSDRTCRRSRDRRHSRRKQNTPADVGPGRLLCPREPLLTEIAEIVAGVDLNSWAHRGLPIKNTLASADAQLVEDAFRLKLAARRSGT